MSVLVVLLIVSAVVVYRHKTWKSLPWPQGALMPPKFQGHRGYWKGGAQENTMASFRSAQERGLTMIEMDIRLSADQVPVVFHDFDLKRLASRDKNVQECTAAQLHEWAQAPTLDEVLSAQDIPRYLNIELKTSAVLDGRLEEKVARLIKKHGAEQRVLFSSFNPLSLWRLSRLLPNVPRALLSSQEDDPENKFYLRHLWFAPYVRLHALHLDWHYVDVAELEKWKRRQVPVALWTVNEKDQAEAYIKAGALSIITDSLGEVVDSSRESKVVEQKP